jgi:hypothetical protein
MLIVSIKYIMLNVFLRSVFMLRVIASSIRLLVHFSSRSKYDLFLNLPLFVLYYPFTSPLLVFCKPLTSPMVVLGWPFAGPMLVI